MEDGKILLALSDGMGSGKEANKISSNVIKMIKKLMSAGFEKEAATELILSGLSPLHVQIMTMQEYLNEK